MYEEQPIPDQGRFCDLTGKTFSRWTVLCFVGRHKGQSYWRCRCTCGTTRDVSQGNLRSGRTKGCQECSYYPGRGKTHGMSQTPEYHLWSSLKQDGRLVKRWHSFEKFFAVVGNRPEGMSLMPVDRKRLIGPDNWKWAKPKYEMPGAVKRRLLRTKNRQKAIINAKKEGATLEAIGDVLGISRERVRQLLTYGPDFKIWKPGERRGPHKKTREDDAIVIKCYNQGMTGEEIADILGIHRSSVNRRLAYLRDDGLIGYRADMSKRKKHESWKSSKSSRRKN